MKRISFSSKVKSGAHWIEEYAFEMDVADDFESTLESVGYKELDNGEWFKRTFHDGCETVKFI